jgi:hypothetical protein
VLVISSICDVTAGTYPQMTKDFSLAHHNWSRKTISLRHHKIKQGSVRESSWNDSVWVTPNRPGFHLPDVFGFWRTRSLWRASLRAIASCWRATWASRSKRSTYSRTVAKGAGHGSPWRDLWGIYPLVN